MNKNLKAFLISFLISGFLAIFMHFKILPQGGKFSPRFQSFSDFSDPLWFIVIFTSIFYGLYLYSISLAGTKESLICPKCEKVEIYPIKESSNKKCSKCNVVMIPLKGYYDK